LPSVKVERPLWPRRCVHIGVVRVSSAVKLMRQIPQRELGRAQNRLASRRGDEPTSAKGRAQAQRTGALRAIPVVLTGGQAWHDRDCLSVAGWTSLQADSSAKSVCQSVCHIFSQWQTPWTDATVYGAIACVLYGGVFATRLRAVRLPTQTVRPRPRRVLVRVPAPRVCDRLLLAGTGARLAGHRVGVFHGRQQIIGIDGAAACRIGPADQSDERKNDLTLPRFCPAHWTAADGQRPQAPDQRRLAPGDRGQHCPQPVAAGHC
jgi:hypothetical protein